MVGLGEKVQRLLIFIKTGFLLSKDYVIIMTILTLSNFNSYLFLNDYSNLQIGSIKM